MDARWVPEPQCEHSSWWSAEGSGVSPVIHREGTWTESGQPELPAIHREGTWTASGEPEQPSDPQGRCEGTWTTSGFGREQRAQRAAGGTCQAETRRYWCTGMMLNSPNIYTHPCSMWLWGSGRDSWQQQTPAPGIEKAALYTLAGMKGALLWPGHREETSKVLQLGAPSRSSNFPKFPNFPRQAMFLSAASWQLPKMEHPWASGHLFQQSRGEWDCPRLFLRLKPQCLERRRWQGVFVSSDTHLKSGMLLCTFSYDLHLCTGKSSQAC